MTYTPSDDAGGRFTIDGGSGVVTVAGADRLNYDTATSHTIEVAATSTSTDGSTSSQPYTVNLSEGTEGLATLNVDIEMTVNVDFA